MIEIFSDTGKNQWLGYFFGNKTDISKTLVYYKNVMLESMCQNYIIIFSSLNIII
jgi:hypothetical protein